MQRVKRPFPRCPYTHCTHRLLGLWIARLRDTRVFKANQTCANTIGLTASSCTVPQRRSNFILSATYPYTTDSPDLSSRHGPKIREHKRPAAHRRTRSRIHRTPPKSKSSTSGQRVVKSVLPLPLPQKSVLLVWCVVLPCSDSRALRLALVAQEGWRGHRKSDVRMEGSAGHRSADDPEPTSGRLGRALGLLARHPGSQGYEPSYHSLLHELELRCRAPPRP